MPLDLITLSNDLKGMPDQALQRELAAPTGAVPPYLVLAEAQRRQLMRSAAQRKAQQPSGTVYDDIMRNLSATQPPPGPPPPAGMTPPPGAPPSGALGSTPPGNFRPPAALAKGGVLDEWDDVIKDEAAKQGLPPDFVRAVMKAEGGGPGKVSPKGAVGPMQVMPETFKEMGGQDINNPEENVRVGIRYLGKQYHDFGGDPRLAAAAYNAGPGAVAKYGGVPPFKETQDYLGRIFGKAKAAKQEVAAAPETAEAPAPAEAEEAAPPTAKAPLPMWAPPAAGPAPNLSLGPTPGPSAVPTFASLGAPVRPTPPDPVAAVEPKPLPGADESDQSKKLRAEIERLKSDAAARMKPSGWQMLADFGWGMAASPSHFLASQIGAGGQAMSKGMAERQQQARKDQLSLLGVDLDLDKQVQAHQEKIAQLHSQALAQAAKAQQDREKATAAEAKTSMTTLLKDEHVVRHEPAGTPVLEEGMHAIADEANPGMQYVVAPKAPKAPTGAFEREFLPGWAADNGTTVDTMTPQDRQKAYMAFKDPGTQAAADEIAAGIMDGTQPPDLKGLYRYGAQVRASLHKNDYDLVTAQRDWAAIQRHFSSLNGATQLKMRQATQFVSETLPYVEQLYDAWMKTGLPTGFKKFNRAALNAAINVPGESGKAAQMLLNEINGLTAEVGSMYRGGNASTDESLRLAADSLHADWSPETFKAAITQLKRNVRLRLNSINNVGPAGVSASSPYLKGTGEGGADNKPQQPARPATIPWDAEAQYSPTRKQWRYRPKGSTEWQTLENQPQ